ncbi:MAG TPA: hypothetical protein GX709_03320 [Clostridiales bacterium]|nr:hypothetical protein [Clostridiales bacterium]
MQGYVKWMDELPKVVKIIFALPFLVILWSIYRLGRSINAKNTLGIVLAVILLFVGPFILWIIDIITLITQGKVLWID